jgi:hypothetical protein
MRPVTLQCTSLVKAYRKVNNGGSREAATILPESLGMSEKKRCHRGRSLPKQREYFICALKRRSLPLGRRFLSVEAIFSICIEDYFPLALLGAKVAQPLLAMTSFFMH